MRRRCDEEVQEQEEEQAMRADRVSVPWGEGLGFGFRVLGFRQAYSSAGFAAFGYQNRVLRYAVHVTRFHSRDEGGSAPLGAAEGLPVWQGPGECLSMRTTRTCRFRRMSVARPLLELCVLRVFIR